MARTNHLQRSENEIAKARTHLYESIDDKQEDGDGGDYIRRDFADWRPIPSELLEVNEMREIVQNAINSLSWRLAGRYTKES
ncbi:MAG: hypothetical protein WAK48_32845 [Candidatus Acidiferrum sp.]|jgi:hypothetical protein